MCRLMFFGITLIVWDAGDAVLSGGESGDSVLPLSLLAKRKCVCIMGGTVDGY